MAKPLILIPPPNNPTWPEVYIYKELAQLADHRTVISIDLPPAGTMDPEYSYQALQQLAAQVMRELHRLPEPAVILWCEAFTGLPTLVRSAEALIGWQNVTHVGLVHGGSFIPGDVMAWPLSTEATMLKQYDLLIAPSAYHLRLQSQVYPALPTEVKLWPLLGDVFEAQSRPRSLRQQQIVFPHRQIAEKGIEPFRHISRPGWKMIETSKKLQRPHYLDMLGESKAVFAAPVMETYGVALEEAMALGCCPVISRHPVYEELYGNLAIPVHWHDHSDASVNQALEEVENCPGFHYPIDRMVSYERSAAILRAALNA